LGGKLCEKYLILLVEAARFELAIPSIYDWWGQWFRRQVILRWLRLRVTTLFADAMQPLDECHFDLRWGRRWREFGDRFSDIKERTRIDRPASNKALKQYFVFEL
jgi:hypothetical protein